MKAPGHRGQILHLTFHALCPLTFVIGDVQIPEDLLIIFLLKVLHCPDMNTQLSWLIKLILLDFYVWFLNFTWIFLSPTKMLCISFWKVYFVHK